MRGWRKGVGNREQNVGLFKGCRQGPRKDGFGLVYIWHKFCKGSIKKKKGRRGRAAGVEVARGKVAGGEVVECEVALSWFEKR